MRRNKLLNNISAIVFVWILFAETCSLLSQEIEQWDIFIAKPLQVDEAVKAALRDLQETGIKYGITFTIQDSIKQLSQNSLLVGSPDRNEQTAQLLTRA
ncbi:hypothetical protein ACFL5Z_19880 [Planctomycetota bacterium]